jgi:hypothetical protein
VTSYDFASRMVDLEVELSSEQTKASRTSASTSAFYQATRVVTTRDALEEFVAADIWPCQPNGGRGHLNRNVCLGWIMMCEAPYLMLNGLQIRPTKRSWPRLKRELSR